jgi:hypothetical protein
MGGEAKASFAMLWGVDANAGREGVAAVVWMGGFKNIFRDRGVAIR